MQGLVLQLTRVGFLLLLWLFIWSVLRILRTDIQRDAGGVLDVHRERVAGVVRVVGARHGAARATARACQLTRAPAEARAGGTTLRGRRSAARTSGCRTATPSSRTDATSGS